MNIYGIEWVNDKGERMIDEEMFRAEKDAATYLNIQRNQKRLSGSSEHL